MRWATEICEKDLIRGCIDGKQKHQEALYARYSPKLFAICLRYANDRPTAEDILQDSFIKIFRNLEKFRFDGSFEGWMRRIAVNTAIEYFRKSTPMYPIVETGGGVNEIVNENILANLNAADLLKLVQELSPGYRTIFNLYAIEGFTHREIAEMLSISEGTSKSQLARARYLLQKRLHDLKLYKTKVYVEAT
ncbi:MAG: RNA polymerase sigma factor [Sphingobacteriales bacterium]|jgi:RNA polymerase sigma factor (sigma-70 family)|nr:RNA polymerase sigma factor [Sphingobacteriales bacterium]MBP9142630.1 RNA polymerase sigma factor [Chitinophagales bacterium]MDA0199605.1 RNA polymerase sigma factor [Bacteroidota bacterium]MBK6891321.1 RNA polymerase sigma factor [Sphingobacteriales bacterium]MBK7526848.1 RNA polymerase sigma factor [Sphingobacteriales bacterium]